MMSELSAVYKWNNIGPGYIHVQSNFQESQWQIRNIILSQDRDLHNFFLWIEKKSL